MQKVETRCNALLEETAEALNEDVLALMLLAFHKSGLELSIRKAVKWCVFHMKHQRRMQSHQTSVFMTWVSKKIQGTLLRRVLSHSHKSGQVFFGSCELFSPYAWCCPLCRWWVCVLTCHISALLTRVSWALATSKWVVAIPENLGLLTKPQCGSEGCEWLWSLTLFQAHWPELPLDLQYVSG